MTAAAPAHVPVVHVCAYYPPRLGGLERVAQSLAELLSRRHEVEVLTTDPGSHRTDREAVRPNLHVTRVPAVEVAHTPVSLQLVWRLLRLPRRVIVHAHVAQAFLPEMVWLTSLLRRRPFIAHFHLDVDASGRFGRLLPAYKRFVLGPVLRQADAVIVLSTEQADAVETRYRVRRDRVTIIPNGVDPSFYDSGLRRSATGGAPLRVLFVGRLDAQKNVARLLVAASRAREPMELVVVGDGEQRPALESLRRQLDLAHVRLVGAQHGQALLAHYAWAEVFVLPSEREGMSLAVLEAMAAGLAVVATDVPGSRELVDGVGLLADPDPGALGAALDLMATDHGLRTTSAARSRQRAAGFAWHDRVAQVEQLYRRVASGS